MSADSRALTFIKPFLIVPMVLEVTTACQRSRSDCDWYLLSSWIILTCLGKGIAPVNRFYYHEFYI